MRRNVTYLSVAALITTALLTGCGSTPTSAPSDNNTVLPSFISSPESTAAETTDSTEKPTHERENGTVISPDSTEIIATNNAPLLKGITLRTSIDALTERYGTNYTYNSGSNSYYWDMGDKGKINAICENDSKSVINEITYTPATYDIWRDAANDYTQVDPSKTYTYAELCNIIGSHGTTYKLSLNIYMKTTYHVCWYDGDGVILSAQFDSTTNKTLRINKI